MAEARMTVIDVLNGLIGTELTATNQYFVHAKLCQHWGYERLAHHFREDSMEEMRDIEELMDRVLQLDGVPNLQRQHPFSVGERVVEQLQLSHTLESGAIDQLRAGITTCQTSGDTVTEDMLRKMLTEEEEQLNWIDAQLALLESLGEQLYLSLQVNSWSATSTPDDQPVRLVSIQSCGDFDAFMEVMNEDRPTLAERGILGRSIYRAVDDPNEIMVTFYFRSRAQAEQFMLSGEDLTRWLERTKVSIYPAVFVGTQVERVVCEQPEGRDPVTGARERSEGGVTSS